MKKASTVISAMLVFLMAISTIIQSSVVLFVILFLIFLLTYGLDRYGIANAWQNISHVKEIKISKNRLRFKPSNTSHLKLESKISFQKITPKKLTEWFASFLKISFVRKIHDLMSAKISNAIAQSGHANNSRILSIQGLAYTLVGMIFAVPAGIITGVFIHPAFYSVCVGIPVLIFSYNLLYLKSLTQSRKSDISHELPVFVVCASVLESVDTPLFESLLKITNSASSLFPTLKREGAMLARNIEYFAMTPIDALKTMAKNHPNREFSSLIYEYTSSYLTGGTASTVTVMEAKAKEFFRNLQFHIKSYTDSANEISQMVLLAFIMLPLMALGMTFIASGDTAASFLIVILFMLPVISIMILMMVDSKQPKSQDTVCADIIPIASAIILSLMLMIASLEAWQALGISVITYGIMNTARQFKRFRQISEIDSALPSFMREISDYHDKGTDVFLAISNIASNSEYNKTFHEMIGVISKKMQFGNTLTRASESANLKSWMSRIVFFILSEIHESGGGNSKTLQMVTSFVEEYTISKKEMHSSLKGSLVIAYIAPVLMVMILVMSLQMTEGLTDDLEYLDELPVSFAPSSITDGFLNLAYMVVMESSVLIALLMSKITYFTVKHSIHVGILSGVSLAMLLAIPYLPNFIS